MDSLVPELLDLADDADAVARARAAIAEDPAALLRCAATIARMGQVPSPTLRTAAAAEIDRIERLEPSLVRELLTEMLVEKHVHLALEWLHQVGFLARLLPELAATVDFSQESDRRHKDVWEHTKLVVRQAVPRLQVRWAALLHDIGKVPTRTFLPDGKVHFHGHAEVGARMFDPIARRFAFDRPARAQIRFLVLHHLRASQYSASWTDSAVRRFDKEMGEALEDLLDLSRADITSRRPGRRAELLQQIHALSTRILQLRALDARQPPLPTGLGTDISARFGIPPSRKIGDIKRALEEAVERGELEERRESAYYLDWIAKSGLV